MAKNTGSGSRHAHKTMQYSFREVLDPYRMEEAEKAATLEKLRGKCLRDGRTDFIDVFFGHRKVWGSALAAFAIMVAWGFIAFESDALFFALVLPMWASWWAYYLTRWPVSRRARATLVSMDRHEPITYGHTGPGVSLYNISTNLRGLPRELRDTHRALWDSALSAFNVLALDHDDEALKVLESAEDRAEELATAQRELTAALEADKRMLDFHSARAALGSSTLHAHEAAHADAEAMLEGARSMRAMTKSLHAKQG